MIVTAEHSIKRWLTSSPWADGTPCRYCPKRNQILAPILFQVYHKLHGIIATEPVKDYVPYSWISLSQVCVGFYSTELLNNLSSIAAVKKNQKHYLIWLHTFAGEARALQGPRSLLRRRRAPRARGGPVLHARWGVTPGKLVKNIFLSWFVQTYIMEGPILLGPHPISIALLSQLSTLGH